MKRLAAATLLLAVCLIAGCSAMPQDVLPSMAGAAATPEQTADAAVSEAGTEAQDNGEVIDYAAEAKMGGSETAKQEVTVAAYVDGDTVHFSVPESVDPSGVLKARFRRRYARIHRKDRGIRQKGRRLYEGKAKRRQKHSDRIRQRELEP